jgi:hypothetical protein
MKTARWYGIFCLSFSLWLLLYPPWMKVSKTYLAHEPGNFDGPLFTVSHSLGHHWRFFVPLHWEWSQHAQRSSLVPDWRGRSTIGFCYTRPSSDSSP